VEHLVIKGTVEVPAYGQARPRETEGAPVGTQVLVVVAEPRMRAGSVIRRLSGNSRVRRGSEDSFVNVLLCFPDDVLELLRKLVTDVSSSDRRRV